jgi:hypothetical protein
VSKETSIHVFIARYRLIAVPGIALCWALAISWFESRAIRLLFSIAIVAITAQQYYGNPIYRHHNESWKDALDVVEKERFTGSLASIDLQRSSRVRLCGYADR